MGYAGFSLKKITRAFWPVARRGGTDVSVLGMQKREIAHGLKLTATSDYLQSIVYFIAMAVVAGVG
jgi:hypothetical protein